MEEKTNFFMEHKIISLFLILIIIGIISGLFGNSSENKTTTPVTDISKFEYSIEQNTITLKRYKGNSENIIISDTYNIDNTNYQVTNMENAIFNGCNSKKIYIPKTMKCVYDDTLAYLSAEHIDIYFEGTEEEWNNIFKVYKKADAKEKWDAGESEEAGKALADKLNEKIGHKYDESKFTYHFEAKVEDIK